ncbi:archaellum operon transcriptional activator EarA family protein [Methanocella conradii]|uniref:archaellum operon transcriptional activator EarA family protein n=1 Tax=Methanocella conradii TaxID=1175444 RepID=UPI00157DB6C8|nr:archaellum operon transcriptional activator EarA family protein [Methanocella conradii]
MRAVHSNGISIESLKRSRSRKRSLVYIGEHPGKTIYEISRGTGVSYANTWGAIMGDDKKYSKKYSLLGMGLVSCELFGNRHVYRLTREGEKMFKILKENPGLFE